jgi:hypothetical protein
MKLVNFGQRRRTTSRGGSRTARHRERAAAIVTEHAYHGDT